MNRYTFLFCCRDLLAISIRVCKHSIQLSAKSSNNTGGSLHYCFLLVELALFSPFTFFFGYMYTVPLFLPRLLPSLALHEIGSSPSIPALPPFLHLNSHRRVFKNRAGFIHLLPVRLPHDLCHRRYHPHDILLRHHQISHCPKPIPSISPDPK